MITILSGFPDNVIAIACQGRVTRKDYDDVLAPAVTATLAQTHMWTAPSSQGVFAVL
jgi:hypothetical protein